MLQKTDYPVTNAVSRCNKLNSTMPSGLTKTRRSDGGGETWKKKNAWQQRYPLIDSGCQKVNASRSFLCIIRPDRLRGAGGERPERYSRAAKAGTSPGRGKQKKLCQRAAAATVTRSAYIYRNNIGRPGTYCEKLLSRAGSLSFATPCGQQRRRRQARDDDCTHPRD